MWTLKRHNGAVVAVSFASQKAYKENQSENTCLEMRRYQSVGMTDGLRVDSQSFKSLSLTPRVLIVGLSFHIY